MTITGGLSSSLFRHRDLSLNGTWSSNRLSRVTAKNRAGARVGRQFQFGSIRSSPITIRRTHCQALNTEQEEDVQRPDVHNLDTKDDSSFNLTSLKQEQDEFPNGGENGSVSTGTAIGGSLLAAVATLGFVVAVAGGGYYFRDTINQYLLIFEDLIEGLGPLGYIAFVLGYAGLEMLAIPAVPLTMSAGLIFGVATGTAMVSIAGTLAATGAFLIARYVARDKILAIIKDNKKFIAIDKAVGNDSFRIVTLLRLSPLLPFSLGNYVYGITSVKVVPYILGSWLGMLPGTWAYVTAGSVGRSLLEAEDGAGFSAGGTQLWTLAIGVAATLGAGIYVSQVVKNAVADIEE